MGFVIYSISTDRKNSDSGDKSSLFEVPNKGIRGVYRMAQLGMNEKIKRLMRYLINSHDGIG